MSIIATILFFEEETGELDAQELEAAKIVAKRIRLNLGKEKSASNKKIAAGLYAETGIRFGSARVRKIINHIRLHGMVKDDAGQTLCLVASSKGYHVSDNAEEIRKYVYSLRQRAHAIQEVAKAIEDQQTLRKSKSS